MKKINYLLRFFCALTLLSFTLAACEKESVEVTPFPGVKTIECFAGDRPTFSFTTNSDWQLSSNALWCTFITSAGEVQDMSGYAGTHTITLRISNLDIANEPTTANITMKANGKEAVIVQVIRGADKPYMQVYDVTDTPIKGISIGYVDYIPFRIEANFRFAAVSIPDWVEVYGGSISGNAGDRVEAMARIVNDGYRERYPITEEDGYYITFEDESGKISVQIPVIFQGMGGSNLTLEGPTSNNFGWEASLDGLSFRQVDEATGAEFDFPSPLCFTITAMNDDYEIIAFEKVVDCGIPSYKDKAKWIHFDKEEMALSIDAAENTRYGLVLALSRTIYNQVRGDIKGKLFESDNATGIDLEVLKYDYLKFVVLEFTQLNFDERGTYEGMYVYHSLTAYEIFCSTYNNSAKMESYGVTEAYTCPFASSIEGKTPGIIIDPRTEGWNTANYEQGVATVELYSNGERLTSKEVEYMVGENKDEVMALHLYGFKENFVSDIDVVFKVNGEAKKLLVVTPPAK